MFDYSSYVPYHRSYESPLVFRLLHKHRLLNQNRPRSAYFIGYDYPSPVSEFGLRRRRETFVEEVWKEPDVKPCFTHRLRPRVIQEGRGVKITCSVDGRPTPKITWLKGREEISETNPRYVIINAHGMCSLEIASCNVMDTGEYKCHAENCAGFDETTCNLFVEGLRRSRRESLTFEQPETVQEFTSRRASLLEQEPSPVEEKRKRREIKFCPQFITQLQSLTIFANSILLLKCKVEGKPFPEVTWKKDNEELSKDERMQCEADDEYVSLRIAPAQTTDSGEYTCILSNEVGSAESIAEVTVKESTGVVAEDETAQEVIKPEKEEEAPKASLTHEEEYEKRPPFFKTHLQGRNLNEGDPLVLTCEIEGDAELKETMWVRNSKEIPENPDFRRENEGNKYSLNVAEMYPEDSGVFGFQFESDEGSRATVCSIIVQAADEEPLDPSVIEFPQSSNAEEGKGVRFSCSLDGTLPLTGKWFFEDTEITDSDRHILSSDEKEFSMEIPVVLASDDGPYHFVASNEKGEITLSFMLHVLS